MKNPDVKLILDASAILAYAQGSIDLGETIAEAVDEGHSFGASVIALAEAARREPDPKTNGLKLITAHGRFHPLPALAEDWPRLAAWAVILSNTERAAAALEAIDRDGYLLTATLSDYTSQSGGEHLPVISI